MAARATSASTGGVAAGARSAAAARSASTGGGAASARSMEVPASASTGGSAVIAKSVAAAKNAECADKNYHRMHFQHRNGKAQAEQSETGLYAAQRATAARRAASSKMYKPSPRKQKTASTASDTLRLGTATQTTRCSNETCSTRTCCTTRNRGSRGLSIISILN